MRIKSGAIVVAVGICVGLSGCTSSSSLSGAKTPEQISDFKGHPPTSTQLQAVMK